MNLVQRSATLADAEAIHALISSHALEGHLLPREFDEIKRHATRFVVVEVNGEIKACAELAPLSARVAEVRSLVVSEDFRRVGMAARLVDELDAYELYDPENPVRSEYRRIKVELIGSGHSVWAYEYNRSTKNKPIIATGNWRTR